MEGKSEQDTSSTTVVIHPVELNPLWLAFGELFIHSLFFKRGIVIVSPIDSHVDKLNEDESFIINRREFVFYSAKLPCMKASTPDTRSLKKTTVLLSTLIAFSLTQQSNIQPTDETSVVLFNKRRREETFMPIIFKVLDEQIGLYIYPWATKSTQNFRFSGFTRFVTAGCLFGVRMRAITQDGDNLELINHRIRLRPGQQIHSIRYDETLGNPFEMVLMNEFKKSCLLIDAFAAPVIPKHLLYHLPAFDYILFGVQLFVRNQMTFEALNAFLHAILLKQSDYQIKIGGLCDEHQIHVDFISPFDNLFHGLDRSNPAEWICNQLGINPLQINTEARDDAEKAVVIICLKHLQTNSTNPILRDIWHDFVAIEPAKQQDIEDLFKIANAVMLAMTARETHDFEICSLLPLSEKQIQVEYDDYSRKYARCYPDRKSNYPAILNLTLFEPVITYSPTTNGLLFYFACALDTLSLLVSDKKLIHYAAKNIALFSKNISETHGDDTDSLTSQPPIDLDLVLGETMKPFGF